MKVRLLTSAVALATAMSGVQANAADHRSAPLVNDLGGRVSFEKVFEDEEDTFRTYNNADPQVLTEVLNRDTKSDDIQFGDFRVWGNAAVAENFKLFFEIEANTATDDLDILEMFIQTTCLNDVTIGLGQERLKFGAGQIRRAHNSSNLAASTVTEQLLGAYGLDQHMLNISASGNIDNSFFWHTAIGDNPGASRNEDETRFIAGAPTPDISNEDDERHSSLIWTARGSYAGGNDDLRWQAGAGLAWIQGSEDKDSQIAANGDRATRDIEDDGFALNLDGALTGKGWGVLAEIAIAETENENTRRDVQGAFGAADTFFHSDSETDIKGGSLQGMFNFSGASYNHTNGEVNGIVRDPNNWIHEIGGVIITSERETDGSSVTGVLSTGINGDAVKTKQDIESDTIAFFYNAYKGNVRYGVEVGVTDTETTNKTDGQFSPFNNNANSDSENGYLLFRGEYLFGANRL